jgi:hypothetical protein
VRATLVLVVAAVACAHSKSAAHDGSSGDAAHVDAAHADVLADEWSSDNYCCQLLCP